MEKQSGGEPRIVVIGGGTGLSVMLRGLKKWPVDITAIVTVGDDGGSSGRLRSELQIPPPGDIRNVLVALADVEPMLSKVLEHRFQSGNGLAGHSLGNLILAAMKEITGDFVTGIQELSKVLAVRGRVLPASQQAIVLKAKMQDGGIVVGESKIPKSGGRIERISIEPENAEPLAEALHAVREADAVVLGPGSLYTSVIPNLLVKELARTLADSRAVKIYICNVMTQPGETDGYAASDHLKAIYSHSQARLVEYMIVNSGEIPADVLARYAEKGARPVRVDGDEVERLGCRIIADRLVQYRTYLRHDADRLSAHIYQLAKERKNGKG